PGAWETTFQFLRTSTIRPSPVSSVVSASRPSGSRVSATSNRVRPTNWGTFTVPLRTTSVLGVGIVASSSGDVRDPKTPISRSNANTAATGIPHLRSGGKSGASTTTGCGVNGNGVGAGRGTFDSIRLVRYDAGSVITSV